MTRDEYVETIVVKGKLVNVGLDDYGQCYFFEYVDDKGELKSVGCGTYNENYMSEIRDYFESDTEILKRSYIDLRTDHMLLVKEVEKLKKKCNKLERKFIKNKKKGKQILNESK